MAHQTLENEITALKLVVSALVVGRFGNPDFADVLAAHLTSKELAALPIEDRDGIRSSVEKLIGRELKY